ncbi:MAG: hypothetical protein LBP74_05200 [Treponema sp.]|jgi:hypothetical protein|nr:hypothetical protein [Treponema sp.]
MYTIGYDFKDTYIECSGYFIAVRLSTVSNIYAPDPDKLVIERQSDSVTLKASGLMGGGGDIKCGGTLTLSVKKAGEDTIVVDAYGSHSTELCRGVSIYCKGVDIDSFTSDSSNMPDHPFVKSGVHPLFYPGRDAMMPLVFAETGKGPYFFLSKDKKVRPKAFSAHFDYIYNEKIITLSHQERTTERKNTIEMPTWKIGRARNRMDVIRERFLDLETHFGLYPFEERNEFTWLKNIKFVLNLHGEHWTGHIFNTFAQMTERLRQVCNHIDGKKVLVFLPAWDGRYYTTYPEHKPSDVMGGEKGLKSFILEAHKLGVKTVLMLGGPNLATYKFLQDHNLFESVMRNEWGDYRSISAGLDWNGDLFFEPGGYIVNFGNPKLRKYMIESVSFLFDNYGADGIFLDGAIRYENTPDFCPVEGIRSFCREIQAAYPEKLLMGEDGFDVLWSAFGLFATSWQPLGLGNGMLRYTRQSMYLSHPDYKGSGGVHESAWFSEGSKHIIKEKTIPAISITRDIDQEQSAILAKLIAAYNGRGEIKYDI